MKPSDTAIWRIGILLGMEHESDGEKHSFSRTRTIEIGEGALIHTCLLDLTVSFENYQENGLARNQAKLHLRTEECETFLSMLIRHEHPLPTDYCQWQEEKGNVVCMHLETTEPPVTFAARLGEAIQQLTD